MERRQGGEWRSCGRRRRPSRRRLRSELSRVICRTSRGREGGRPRGKRRACRLQPCRTVGAASRGLQAIVCGLCWRRTYSGRRAATLSVAARPTGRSIGSCRTSSGAVARHRLPLRSELSAVMLAGGRCV